MWPDDDRVRVGTVHTFQGGQRDVMMLSPVAAHNTPPRATHWVASQVNLWNVAITRAKSQLITVGATPSGRTRAGCPPSSRHGRRCWERSTTAEASAPGPVTEARADLADRLQQYLTGRGITDLERAVLVGGHPVDLLFTDAGENTAVLIDLGPRAGADPARHLRLIHARGDLLTGLSSGGRRAKPCPVNRTVRVPAWRIITGGTALAPLFDSAPGKAVGTGRPGTRQRPAQPPGRLRTTYAMCWDSPPTASSSVYLHSQFSKGTVRAVAQPLLALSGSRSPKLGQFDDLASSAYRQHSNASLRLSSASKSRKYTSDTLILVCECASKSRMEYVRSSATFGLVAVD
ncbi:AAA domain-containing protein [Streptomyces sp. NPDC051985]|uniref:AAA domain-containing protein n=1 Tax=Streptomyces sp. NPDC051985 TaxID=3155807 RepID=UPI003421685D